MIFNPATARIIQSIADSPAFPLMEFTLISSATILIYLGIHLTLNNTHKSIKMLISMLFGTIAYSAGKLVVLAAITVPKVPF